MTRPTECSLFQVEATLQKVYDSFVAMTDKVLEAQKTVAQAVRDHRHKITEATTAPPTDETTAPPTDENVDTVASTPEAYEPPKAA